MRLFVGAFVGVAGAGDGWPFVAGDACFLRFMEGSLGALSSLTAVAWCLFSDSEVREK